MKYIKLYEEFMGMTTPSLEKYRDRRQSMARFSPGMIVKCVNPELPCHGLTGRIVTFEDAYIRWEVVGSDVGVGLSDKQYRCLPQDLEPVAPPQPAKGPVADI